MPIQNAMPSEFWRGRRVLITGHTGFKGAWLWLWLRRLGAKLTGYALAPPSCAEFVGHRAAQGRRSVIADVRDAGAGARGARSPRIRRSSFTWRRRRWCASRIAIRSAPTRPTCSAPARCCRPAGSCENLRVRRCRHQRQGLREPRCGPAFEEGDRLGGAGSVQQQQGLRRTPHGELSGQFLRRRAAARHGARRQRHRRRRLVRRPADSRLRARARRPAQPVTLRYPEAIARGSTCSSRWRDISRWRRLWCKRRMSAPRAVNFGPDAASFCAVREVVDAFSARFGGKPGWQRDTARNRPRHTRADPVVGARRARARLAAPARVSAKRWRGPRTGIGRMRRGRTWCSFREAQIARYRALRGGGT